VVKWVRFVVDYFVDIVRAVVDAGVTVFAQFFVSVIAHVPTASWSIEVSSAEILILFNFKWQFKLLHFPYLIL
jgi:hypothetical protein